MSDQSERMPDDHSAAHERLKGADKLLSHRVEAVEDDVKDLRKDVTSMQNERWFVYGAVAAISAAATWILRGLGLKE